MASGADMRGGPQQRPPALQHVREYVEEYEAGLSGSPKGERTTGRGMSAG